MKKLICVAVAALVTVAAGLARADEIVVGTGETFAFTNTTDVTQSDAVRVSDRAVIEQRGTGTTTLKSGTFTENKPVSINVRAGTVKLETSEPILKEYAKPEAVMNKAAFWVDAEKNLQKREGSSDEVTTWLDVRETGAGTAESPYVYTRAVAFTNNYLTACPLQTNFLSKTGVGFRGLGSGCFMNWVKPDGTQQKVENIRHAFIVHGATANATVGNLLGQRMSGAVEDSLFLREGDSYLWYPNAVSGPKINSARTYLNGTEVDAARTKYGASDAIYAVEVETLAGGDNLGAMCFFNDRDFQIKATDGSKPSVNPILGTTAQMNGGNRVGGGILYEVLVFTNNLTAAERIAVSDWLNQKWRGTTPPTSAPAATVALATNAVVEIDAAAFGAGATVTGAGTLRKTGDDAREFDATYAPRNLSLKLDVAAGSVNLHEAMPLAVAAGDTISAERELYGTVIAAPTAGTDATKLVKEGAGSVTLDALPEGVTRIEVNDGELRLADPEASSEGAEWELPNGDFETHEATFNTAAFSNASDSVTGYVLTQRTDEKREKISAAVGYLTTFSPKGVENNKYFNFAWNKKGITQLYMSGEGPTLTTTTFTPPAGTWCFRADFSTWAVNWQAIDLGYTVAAKLKVGEKEIDLGSVSTDSHALLPRTWPNAFTADGATSVTLTLTGSSFVPSDARSDQDKLQAHGILDNLTLVREANVETSGLIVLPRSLEFTLAEGAKLALDFAGTNVVSRLRIGGKNYRGIVSLATHPELLGTLSGCGTLLVEPKGLILIVR